MGLEEREIGIDKLAAGMYVCRLDRPWTETPFPLQGFMVESDDDLALLRQYCQSVWIDIERGLEPPDAPRLTLGRRTPAPAIDETQLGKARYADSRGFDEELPDARRAHHESSSLAQRIIEDVRAGRKLSGKQVEDAVTPVVQSVLRNADTMFWVNALQRHDGYAYSHAINCSALAAAFGRHLGLPEALLMDVAAGGLLLDIGKTRLAPGLLDVSGPLDAAGIASMRGHVELGLAALDESATIAAPVREMVRSHHERYDGSGYPDQLADASIPLFGRIGGIVDTFDALTSDRPHARAIARHEALQVIYRERDRLFQRELVEQFIGCLGVYPTGSLVELSTGEVGVVMTQNPMRRLLPRVMLLTDADKRLRDAFEPLDLMERAERQPELPRVEVVRPLERGAHGLDPADLFL
ncbi:HD-GYP domain-containing protein [Lysobacter sp. A3-1-A15]|uniref:HD-GYP domain-containing protein n=1 Tax=Novilysobacter viscosus TaxID=3098602 RepID=UPI002ED8FABD